VREPFRDIGIGKVWCNKTLFYLFSSSEYTNFGVPIPIMDGLQFVKSTLALDKVVIYIIFLLDCCSKIQIQECF